jgi:hypothetical protein
MLRVRDRGLERQHQALLRMRRKAQLTADTTPVPVVGATELPPQEKGIPGRETWDASPCRPLYAAVHIPRDLTVAELG